MTEKQRSGVLSVGRFEAKLPVFEPMKWLDCLSRLSSPGKGENEVNSLVSTEHICVFHTN